MATSNLADKARDQLGSDLRDLVAALGERAVQAVTDRLTDATGRLGEYARQGGGPGLIAAATGVQKLAEGHSPMQAVFHAGLAGGKEKLMSAFGAGGKRGRGGRKLKVTNIVETIEVGVPVRVAYNQWTQFGDFPSFMKKVARAETDSDEKLTWKAQVFWSHRTWESTIVRQIPDRLIHWRSTGEKGAVDGTVSFHETGPELTRILVVLEYHPQGLFEHAGNLWRAQGRRVRLELKHFVRHVMTRTVLDPDSVEGWRGEIEDSRVVKDHETALREEREARERPRGQAEEAEEERGRRRLPPRGRAAEWEEEYDAYDEGDDYDEDEYAEDEYVEEPPEEEAPRRRQPERARRLQSPRERAPREERTERVPREERTERMPREERAERVRPRPTVRRSLEPSRRPVARRRREEQE